MPDAGHSRTRGLTVRGVRLRYPGGPWILEGTDFTVAPGECIAIRGGNGAGKSTLLSILSGIIPGFIPGEWEGQCLFDGTPLSGQSPACLRQNPDDQILCDDARDELDFYIEHSRAREGGARIEAEQLAREMGITALLDRPVHRLSSGEKQRFALAASLAFSDARLLLLDEPTAFLDGEGRRRLGEVLAERKLQGACILMTGHEFAGLEGLIDRGLVLGQPVPAVPPQTPTLRAAGPILLSAVGLCAAGEGGPVFSRFDLELRAGQTAGLCGPNGSGKSTLARVLAGLQAPAAGHVRLSGREVRERDLWRTVVLAGQNPYHGLFHATLGECLAAAWRLRSGVPVLGMDEGVAVLGLQGLWDRDPQTLSFGEAQKAAILCAVLCGPQVLVVDEPLLDFDQSSLGGLRRVCDALNAAGKAVLLVSHVPGVLERFCAGPLLSLEAAPCATQQAA